MIISESLVQLNLNATTKDDALKQLATIAAKSGKINNEAEYINAVLKREAEFSTAVGFGIAIPHGKSNAVNEPFFMFARVGAIDWDSMDGEPIDMIFLIGVPMSDASSTHLKILASLSRKLMKEPFRNSLREAQTPKDLLDFLEASELGI